MRCCDFWRGYCYDTVNGVLGERRKEEEEEGEGGEGGGEGTRGGDGGGRRGRRRKPGTDQEGEVGHAR